jgi:hypothetical protein
MTERKPISESEPNKGDKLQELLPPGRERVNQGQQFDEMQRQQKNPDGSPRNNHES